MRYRDARRRYARTALATIALVALVVVLASAALGAALRDLRERGSAGAPSTSPEPTTAPTTSAPTAPASPTATPQSPSAAPLSARYGVIIDGQPPYLRSETDPQRIGQLSGDRFIGAVSPDGRKIAYWQHSNDGARALWVLDPSAGAQPRMLLTLPSAEIASTSTFGGVVWSTDATGLLIAVNSADVVQGPPDAPYRHAALREVDGRTASVREIARKERSFAFFPVAWDRDRGVAAAVESAPGGFASGYVTVRGDGSMQETRLPPGTTLPRLVRAAPDASRVLMLLWEDPVAISVWPLTDPTQRVTLPPQAGERVVAAMWRDAREIVVSVGRTADASQAERLEVWTLDGQRRVVLSAKHRLDAVRPDGTAAITSAGVVDLATGASAKMPSDPGSVAAAFLLPDTYR